MKKTFSNKNHKILLLTFAFLIFTFTFSLVSCNTTEPRPKAGDGYRLTLEKEDASCTEAWLKAGVKNFNLPVKVNLYLNDSLKKTITLTTQDTVIYDDGLLPVHTYKYRAEIEMSQEIVMKSQTVTVITMDTTSHDFTWQTYTFGGANGSSILRDVAIINENDIWAVGEIHTSWTDQWDSNGVWVQPYNAVHWDGEEWELRRIYVNYRGRPNLAPLQGVFALPNGKVVFSSGLPYLPEKDHWKLYHLWDMGILNNDDGSVYSIWGTSLDNLYFVGNKGTIVHYDGSGWEKIESGTETQIRDIWGYYDKVTRIQKVLCAVSNVITLGENKILEINEDNTISDIPWNTGDSDKRVNSIWFNDNHQIFTCGGGVFIGSSKGLWKKQDLPSIHTNKIRGNEKNDVFVAGDFGLLAHFNGVDWEVYNTGNVALFYSLSYRNNILTAVGERNGKAVILKMNKK